MATRKLIRVYHAHPAYSGRQHRLFGPLARFDYQIRDRHQNPKLQLDGRGVIYLADKLETALAEAFQDQGVEVGICPNMRAVSMSPALAVELLDLGGNGVMKIGALAGLASGNYRRRLTQRWGRRIYEDLDTFAGIRYRGAHQHGLCVVGWERTGPLTFDAASDLELDGPLWTRVVVALQGTRPNRDKDRRRRLSALPRDRGNRTPHADLTAPTRRSSSLEARSDPRRRVGLPD